MRHYRVELVSPGPGCVAMMETVEAHRVDPSNGLLFFDDADYLVRAFAPGTWASVTILPAEPVPEQPDLYAAATKAAVSG